MATPRGPNPLCHILLRQSGDNINNFRKNMFRERLNIAKNLYRKDLVSHFGCVNAIEFSTEGKFLISGGDDRRVLLWQFEKTMDGITNPCPMEKQHQSNIFCLAFNNDNTKIFSGGNDDRVIVHDIKASEASEVFLHAKPVYGLSVDQTNDQIFSTAGEDGRVLLFDLRQGTEVMALAKYRAPFHAVQFHPLDGNFVITANGKEGAAFWDLRHTKMPSIRYGGEDAAQSCMSVRFNTLGTQVLALRRRLPPILYNTCMQTAICQFYHPDYYNSCTMKSCCFAGDDDEFVLSGSDDFNLYVWRVSDADTNKTNQWIDTYQMVLSGHRSIVNQVRYNAQKCIIASSGVEKVVKLWFPFEMNGWKGSLLEEGAGYDNPRDVFSHEEYVSLVNSSGQNMTHDYSNQNTFEDPRMMAFFDSLVQREIESWNSNNSGSDKSSQHTSDGSSRPTSPESSDSESISNYVSSNVEPCRRRQITMKPRTIYANRIAYLIATKRNTLKRLALKGSAHTERRVKSYQINFKRNSSRITRKGIGKRAGRVNNSKNRSRDDNSDSEVPTKSTKRRIQPHHNTGSYRSFKRKIIIPPGTGTRYDSPNSSSDDDTTVVTPYRKDAKHKTLSIHHEHVKNVNAIGHSSSYSSSNVTTTTTTTTTANIIDHKDVINVNNDNSLNPTTSNFSNNLAVPSTSTGITATASFRVPPHQFDSDDDQSPASPAVSPVNLVRVVPLPINGKQKELSHSCSSEREYENDEDDDNDDDDNDGVDNGGNVDYIDEDNSNELHYKSSFTNRKRTHNLQNDYSSHSNSRLSCSSPDTYGSSSDSLQTFLKKKKRKYITTNGKKVMSPIINNNNLTHHNNNNNNHHSQNYQNNSHERSSIHTTPIAAASTSSRYMQNFTPDSGIGMTACTSSSSVKTRYNSNNNQYDRTSSFSKADNTATTTGNNAMLNENGDATTSMKIFQNKLAKIRRNYQLDFGDDSDSERSN